MGVNGQISIYRQLIISKDLKFKGSEPHSPFQKCCAWTAATTLGHGHCGPRARTTLPHLMLCRALGDRSLRPVESRIFNSYTIMASILPPLVAICVSRVVPCVLSLSASTSIGLLSPRAQAISSTERHFVSWWMDRRLLYFIPGGFHLWFVERSAIKRATERTERETISVNAVSGWFVLISALGTSELRLNPTSKLWS